MNIACAIMKAGGGECQGDGKASSSIFFFKRRDAIRRDTEPSRVRSGSSGKDHHLPSLTRPQELSFLTGQSF